MSHDKPRIRLACAVFAFCAASAAHADEAALQAEVETLRAEVAALKEAVRQMQADRAPNLAVASTAAAAPAPASSVPAPSSASAANPGPGAPNPGIALGEGTTLWGYGQLDYNHPTAHAADAQADLTRAVIGFNHVFDESTRVYGEFEWEHAVTSNVDQGESEVEQLYVEHALSPSYGVRAGLMLVPLGLLNEHHEPTQYYGVERNFVEQAIIPSTWREGGVAAYGSTDAGFNWNVAVVTGPDLGNWDPTSDEGRASPLGSIHQELQLAHAHDPSVWAAVNWLGIPGLDLGGGVFGGKIGQDTSKRTSGDANFAADDARLLLGEVHARWQTGPFDVSALYTRATISDTRALNLSFVGQPTPVPKSFWGGYVQGAWRALEWNTSSFVPFLRYEAFNTGASYAAQPAGFGTPALPTQRVWTGGINYYLNPNVVFKIDYQDFRYDDVALGYGNRFDLGIGYQF
ncbi:MAG TPA: porin [Rudaea sp.]|nr:porin [Rudaea sp.]